MKTKKLYNIIFPTFMLFAILPHLWLISLVGNFIIDSIVIFILFAVFLKKQQFKLYKKVIFPIWILGFIADAIGTLYLTITAFLQMLVTMNHQVI